MTSVIILTYNSQDYIEKLVTSIYENNKGQEFEIIVVDNKSGDDTIKAIKRLKIKDLRLKIIENKKNYGFAKGINIGVKEAKGKYLLFINPDCEWKEGTIQDLLKVFDRNEKIGIVGGKMMDRAGVVEKSAGKFFGLLESTFTAVGLDNVAGVRFSPSKIQKVDFVSGGFMMVRKSIFDELSGFDENLFMYLEDMEFCYRARQMDTLTYFTPEASVIHDSHGSSSRSFAIKNIYSGMFYFQKKHKGAASYIVVKSLFFAKARALVLAGKMLNNKNLTETYTEVLKK